MFYFASEADVFLLCEDDGAQEKPSPDETVGDSEEEGEPTSTPPQPLPGMGSLGTTEDNERENITNLFASLEGTSKYY